MRNFIRFVDPFVRNQEDKNRHYSCSASVQESSKPERCYDTVRPQHRADIVGPEYEDLIDTRLLLDLAEMEDTIDSDPWALTREEKVLSIMCRELKTVGYRHIKAKMDRGDIPVGDLRYGSAWNFIKVGPVVEFVTPLEEVEVMWCTNQKAIEIIDRWPTFDDFYDVWNARLGRHATSWDKVIVVREYRSIDYGITDKYPAYPVTDFITLDKVVLEKHWNRVSVRVEALKRIDQMRDHIHDAYRIRRHKRMRDDEEDMNANQIICRCLGY